MSNATVVIPTYWTWPSSESHRLVTASFDHPTPLDGDSTLPRLLDDLCEQRGADFHVLILTGLAHPELGEDVAEHMRTLLRPYHDRLDIYTCDAPVATQLIAVIEAAGLTIEALHLGSYNGVRNFQLLVPHVMGAQVIVALDDDERIEPDYMTRALSFIGEEINGHRVLGLAGPYLQPDGSVLLNEPAPTGNPFLDKARHINDAMRTLMSGKGRTLVPSPMALGGNMVFHHDLFTRVPFDPGITRGEDIDYLINARLQGITWWFDAGLSILHLPPKHYDTHPYQRMREDVFRFIYEREKLSLHDHIEADWLDPYPGTLLKGDLVEHAQSALQTQATPDVVARFGDPQTIVEQAQAHAAHYAPQYNRFAHRWEQLASHIEQNETLRHELAASIHRL